MDSSLLPTLIIRHPRERIAKCSLRGLETHPAVMIVTYPKSHQPGHPIGNIPFEAIHNRLVLRLGGPPLGEADLPAVREHGLLLVDGTWRLAEKIFRALDEWPGLQLHPRSLPDGWRTAYPRRQTECPDPEVGLASVEALWIAHRIAGLPTDGLFANYHWGDAFLELNESNVAADNT
ncbi:MAG: hypothetical protein AB7K09_02355 [Planctomycetota bacterium]